MLYVYKVARQSSEIVMFTSKMSSKGNQPNAEVTSHGHCLYFSSNLFQVMADRLIEEKFVTEYDENGWVYVMVDDCWSEMKRDDDGKLRTDYSRFEGGMKDLADYVSWKWKPVACTDRLLNICFGNEGLTSLLCTKLPTTVCLGPTIQELQGRIKWSMTFTTIMTIYKLNITTLFIRATPDLKI